MKLLSAILITLALLAVCYVISAEVYFDLSWILVGITSIWAAIDSKRIELARYKLGLACRPLALFCCCYLLWIFVFPWYLWARLKIKEGTVPLKDESLDNLGPIRRFFRRHSRLTTRLSEWLVITLAGLKIAILLLCIEESWRGRVVWENYRHQLEAKGESLDWNALIPPPVLDSQNVFGVPMMSVWFVKSSGNNVITEDLSKRLKYLAKAPEMLIAEVTVKPPGARLRAGNSNVILQLDDFASRQKARKLIEDITGTSAVGVLGDNTLTAEPLDTNQIKPAHIILESEGKPDARDLVEFFSGNNTGIGALHVRETGSNTFRVLTAFCPASNYLKWSDQFNSDFDLMRQALQRPYARMNGDYHYPPTIPMPNFVNIRIVAQTLAQRAQCYLLLGQPDNALRELTLLNRLRHLLENTPTGKPMSLVSAMINVAVTGLYVDVIADGFRLHEWHTPQLTALQQQLEQINLAPYLKESFHEEQVSIWTIWKDAFAQYQTRRVPNATLWQKLKNLRPPYVWRGFFYLNAYYAVEMEQEVVESIDTTQNIVVPERMAEVQQKEKALEHHFFPYKLLLAIAVPNFEKAVQTYAYNQTKVNEARIVCALERYHISHGTYPETLAALVPQFIDKVPDDLIGGQPLKYRHTTDGQFMLYSVGWNGVDDGGQLSLFPYDRGDWSWQ